MEKVNLSNNFSVFCENKSTAKLLFSQINDYFQHGISFEKDDVIFDVGANIGIFSMWIYHQLQGDVHLYAFEPIPNIYSILEKNTNISTQEKEEIKLFNYALMDKYGLIDFSYYPNASPFSSALPYDDRDKNMFLDMANASLESGNLLARIFCLLPISMRNRFIQKQINKMFIPSVIKCKAKTLSQVIKEENLDHIDLLKIDVEKTEMEVLLGIDKLDWKKIKKIVIEVHDYQDRLNSIKSLLESNEYNITVDQEEMFVGSNIYNVFATKA
ncbi:FkbM family methyltransferase [Acaryochloris marina NIES-2412]|uniref:FkbM family methyltransferase n=1 Tax=Acaryochloris marina TaxID=155978 RepID=UPI004058912E